MSKQPIQPDLFADPRPAVLVPPRVSRAAHVDPEWDEARMVPGAVPLNPELDGWFEAPARWWNRLEA